MRPEFLLCETLPPTSLRDHPLLQLFQAGWRHTPGNPTRRCSAPPLQAPPLFPEPFQPSFLQQFQPLFPQQFQPPAPQGTARRPGRCDDSRPGSSARRRPAFQPEEPGAHLTIFFNIRTALPPCKPPVSNGLHAASLSLSYKKLLSDNMAGLVFFMSAAFCGRRPAQSGGRTFIVFPEYSILFSCFCIIILWLSKIFQL